MNSKTNHLYLHEELTLLALRDDKGTFASVWVQQAVGGAVLAELLLERRISIEDTKKALVNVIDPRPFGDPIVDECLEKLRTAKRRTSLKGWVSRLAGIKDLRQKVAQRLCARGILRNDETKVLLFFTRQLYPEIDSKPEQEIIERLREAIFTDREKIDPRTTILLSLASGADLLNETFGRKEIKIRKERIEQIVNGEMMGAATREVIAACQAAVMVAVFMPTIIATIT